MSCIAGVDGCRAGWVAALKDMDSDMIQIRLCRHFSEVVDCPEAPEVIMVDIPIGLLDAAVPGGRECDRQCRALLSGRNSSVFSAPVRGCLDASSYEEAKEVSRASSSHNIAISKQAFAIIPKIREVDEVMTHKLQDRIFEAHPELSFTAMNRDSPMQYSKRTNLGQTERRQVLSHQGYSDVPIRVDGYLLRQVAQDDILDAYAMLWTAERKFLGTAVQIPAHPSLDVQGLKMEMWY